MGHRKVASHQELLDLALRAGTRAAAFIRGTARPDASTWDRKAQNDFATDVDREAERIITAIVLAGAPGSVVMGEETTDPTVRAAPTDRTTPTWVVDPLDGTTNYLHDYPVFAVSIAAVVDGRPVAAVVIDVVRELIYWAAAGMGAWCGERRLSVSTLTDPALALIGTGFPFKAPANTRMDEYLAQFRRVLRHTSGIRRAGSAAIDLAHVAEGRLDGFWEIGLSAWDVAAGVLLVREAGGIVTDFDGRPSAIMHGDYVAGSTPMHRWLLGQLGPQARD